MQKVINSIKVEGYVRSVVIIFYLEMYIDLLYGGLINTENDYLFDIPENWGPNGYLTISDQFTVLLGNFFYFTCLVFPFVCVYLLHMKSRIKFGTKYQEIQFDSYYEVLYEIFKTTNSGIFHYYFVYMMRRFIFAFVTYYMYDEVYTSL